MKRLLFKVIRIINDLQDDGQQSLDATELEFEAGSGGTNGVGATNEHLEHVGNDDAQVGNLGVLSEKVDGPRVRKLLGLLKGNE